MKNKELTECEKQLLLQELSMRLPYEVDCEVDGFVITLTRVSSDGKCCLYNKGAVAMLHDIPIENVRPLLRTMDDVTHEEIVSMPSYDDFELRLDWYLRNHIDFRGMIDTGLAKRK